MIKHLKHTEIDSEKWDKCIKHSVNALPYAFSWWLDIVSPGWEALIEDDYRSVMPLTAKRKFGFAYLYQPFFTQQLGIFSIINPDQHLIHDFVNAIPDNFRYIDIHLNTMNQPLNGDYVLYSRIDFLLNLTSDYVLISSNYHRNCRRNIQKAIHAGLTVKPGPGPTVFSRFIRQNLERKLSEVPGNIYPLLQNITQASIQHQCGEINGVYGRKGELLAAGWFVHDCGRCFFMVCASTSEGKKNQATYLLVDHIIRAKSGSGITFDFTGSNIPGVAYFNEGFGAGKTHYTALKRNRLPWPLKLLKR